MTVSISTECCRHRLNKRTDREHLLPRILPEAIAIVRDTRALPYQHIECFHQARLIRITQGRLPIWLDPLGMLDPQVVVNLFPQVCVCLGLMNHDIHAFAFISLPLPWRQPTK